MGAHLGSRPSGNSTHTGSSRSGLSDLANVVTTVGTTNISVPISATYKVFILGAGGGGNYSSGSTYAGDGGFFEAEIPFQAGDNLEIGVGQGGVYSGTSAQISAGSYVMRGGRGYQGQSYYAGDGGGGSYIRVTNGASTHNHQNFVIIAGGGGGIGNHGATGQWGGFGFGVGGGSWNAEWGGRTASSSSTGGAGYNGYNSGGGGGYPRSYAYSWNYGGGSTTTNQYHGGDGGHPVSASTTDWSGGGGGGGAGGGGGSGSGGDNNTNIGAGAGGALSGTTTVSGYTAVIVPRGGGGGGGHNSDCAASGGGGGALLFSTHNPSWGSGTIGSDIPHHNTSNRATDYNLAAINQYNAYATLSSYSTTYFGYNATSVNAAGGGILGLGYGGGRQQDGTNGCVIIATKNVVVTPTIL